MEEASPRLALCQRQGHGYLMKVISRMLVIVPIHFHAVKEQYTDLPCHLGYSSIYKLRYRKKCSMV